MCRIDKKGWGETDGKEVFLFTLTNAGGMKVEITNFGGIIVSIFVPDREGKLDDILLGCDTLEGYLDGHPYFGALIGRHANRIDHGRMTINGVKYQLAVNNGNNHLHGGGKGFDKAVWTAEIRSCDSGECLELTYFSRDGEENYPGNLSVKVTYSLSDDNGLSIEYWAQSDRDTAVNLTNHAYFNLSGHAAGDILGHEILLNASRFTPINGNMIPTGEWRAVAGTPMDFTQSTPVGLRISDRDEQLDIAGGYDHNWVLDGSGILPGKAAELYDPSTGRVMEVYTTKPGIQFYTGNFLDGAKAFKGGAVYDKRSGLCLETQYFPDAVNHPDFPSSLLKAGQEYKHKTLYKFGSRK